MDSCHVSRFRSTCKYADIERNRHIPETAASVFVQDWEIFSGRVPLFEGGDINKHANRRIQNGQDE